MKKQKFITFILSLMVVLVLVACSAGTSPAPSSPASGSGTLDGKTLVETRCTACHGINRVQQKRKASDWPTIVDSMISRGANLNSDEKTAVINYLTTNFSN
jgi:hypothetical protein